MNRNTIRDPWGLAFLAAREIAACRRARAFLEVLLWEQSLARNLYDAACSTPGKD
ncbi:MAG: hypothetical protein VW547_05480 [Alphaproteobacteria bacterium]